MKRILFVLPFLFGMAYGQSKLYMRADTIQMYKDGGNANLKLMNATRDSLGPLVTIGQGRTKFISYRAFKDSLNISGVNIYNSDGTLTGNRKLSGALTYNLRLDSLNEFHTYTYHNEPGYYAKSKIVGDGWAHIIESEYVDSVATERYKGYINNTASFSTYIQKFAWPSGTQIGTTSFIQSWNGFTLGQSVAGVQDTLQITLTGTGTGTAGTLPKGALTDSILTINNVGKVRRINSSLLGGGTTETASNGLTNVTNDIQLGGSLTGNTTIAAGGNNLAITGSDVPFKSTTTSVVLPAIQGINNSGGNGVEGSSTTGIAVTGASTGGTAIQGTTNTGVAGILQINPATTNTAATVLRLNRLSSGSAANGIGGSIDFLNEDTGGSANISNQIVSTWSDATNATRTSEFKITGVNSGTTADKFIVKGNGVINIPTALGNYANNAAAIAGGLAVGDLYRNGDVLQVVH